MSTVTAPQRIIDVSRLARRYQRLELLWAFDSLRPGESLCLVSPDDPQCCLDELRSERKGLFEWSPLEPEGNTWRIEITRRSAIPGDFRRLTEAAAWDHQRLRTLEMRALEAVKARDIETARGLFRAFAYGLHRHVLIEEDLVFPVFEDKTGQAGTTAGMRAEHSNIRMLLDSVAEGLEVSTLHDALVGMLTQHNGREESIIYQALDRVLSEIEADALVGAIQEFPS